MRILLLLTGKISVSFALALILLFFFDIIIFRVICLSRNFQPYTDVYVDKSLEVDSSYAGF